MGLASSTVGDAPEHVANVVLENGSSTALIDVLPAAVYTTDAAGRITSYNQAAVELWGCRPELGKSEFCGSWKLYWPDGTPLPHDECPMALALEQKRPVRGMEAIAERPDGTRVPFIPYPTPLFDASGALTGAINMLVDITERKRNEETLRQTQGQLASELAATRRLQKISTLLIQENDVEALNEEILDAAVAIMGSDMATLQIVDDSQDALRLLAWRGLDPSFGKIYGLSRPDAKTACSVAWRIGYRIVVPDVETCDFLVGTPALDEHRRTGIGAVQSTPLISRAGRILGMISTLWRQSHQPSEHALGLLDVLARQAAELIERKHAGLALAERDAQLTLAGKTALVGSYVFDLKTGRVQTSAGYVAIYGLSEGTEEYRRDEWQDRVHPDDRARLDALRSEAFTERRSEHTSEYRIIRPGGEVRWIESRALLSYDGNGRPARMIGVNIDVTERKRAEEQQRILVAELDHRVKNALATASAVVSQTLNASNASADLAVALNGRLKSMGLAHELLSSSWARGISLAEIVRCELAPYSTSNNTEISGPEIILTAEAGQTIAMVFHELVTNAAKHGALSTPEGRVLVRWKRQQNGNPRAHLVVEWQEIGGPSVVAPGKSGYGTSIVRELIPYELGGTVDLTFGRDGVRCRMEIPGECFATDQHFNQLPGRAEPRVEAIPGA